MDSKKVVIIGGDFYGRALGGAFGNSLSYMNMSGDSLAIEPKHRTLAITSDMHIGHTFQREHVVGERVVRTTAQTYTGINTGANKAKRKAQKKARKQSRRK